MSLFGRDKRQMVDPADALPGRSTPLPVPETHLVSGRRIQPPFPEGLQTAVFGMGCFWGAERLFWQTAGVYSTAVGYSGGFTPNPTYEETCTNRTGHAEVLVVFDPTVVPYEQLLKVFWEEHDPTQGMRQAGDVGTTYRSAVHWVGEEQREVAEASRDAFAKALADAGVRRGITTEVAPLGEFYYAEDYHQQYLARVPNGYCGLAGTGVSCPGTQPSSDQPSST